MIELLAAIALAPWAHPLAFRPLPGWHTGASGTVNIFQAGQVGQKPIRLDLRHAKHFACCEGAYVAGGSYELEGVGPGAAYSVIVRVYFGSRPTPARRAHAQRALDRLKLPPLR